ncbi:MAG: MotA/TolQ/ExbB proton channel family protein [Verrucomicrobiota bacterium]
MLSFLQEAGYFLYPLGAFSILAGVIIVERLIVLREAAVVPSYQKASLFEGKLPELRENDRSIAAELVRFYLKHSPTPETFQAFAKLQVTRLERGLFILDFVVSAAPLVGLLGTVTGLVEVFATFSEQPGIPNPEQFVAGISLALTTTILGLAIAIPALVASAYFNRRVDTHAARLEVVVEHLVAKPSSGEVQ